MSSSFIALLFQFHMKASYLITLSCFKNMMKLNKCCSRANLDGHPKVQCGSLVELAWVIMVGTTSCTNFSNSPKLKLMKYWNKSSVAYMVIRMSCTTTSRLINCPFSSSNLANVKYSQILTRTIVTCIAIWSSVGISFKTIFCHYGRSSSQDVVK